ncbi:ribokinase [Micromonospora kangleipakensis]|uniref:Deoxyribokinase n=1 Tax=Micromonospora kangleipakensis TaxID=1077942 RepID=A0A4Q8BEB8_9ACTN|nr:ribokinase [Micromonospora kangleipakensis]RZU76028.1 ribokinase [Micromonospora kangleipakensis]
MTAAEGVRIVVIGSTMVDMISYMPRVPDAGETLVGDHFALGFGGKGANQAVMARRLGADVWMVGCLGVDAFGDMTLENFAASGIDTTFVTRTPDVSSGVAPIWVEAGGDNRIVCVPGANACMTEDQARTAVESVAGVDVVIGQFEVPQNVTTAGFRAAKERGAITVLNPAPAAEISPDLLAVTDWLIPNEVEFAFLSKDSGISSGPTDAAVSDLAQRLGVHIVATLGEAGAAVFNGTRPVVRITPVPVEVVDTTGAGDAFVGAFSYGLAAGLSPATAARLGCACATSSVTRAGTQSSFPLAAQIGEALAWATNVP